MNAYDGKDFAKAAISFDAIISLLPEDYRPEVSSPRYEELTQSKRNVVCDKCRVETPRQDIYPYKVLLSSLDRLITKEQVMIVWACPKCNYARPLLGTKTKLIKYDSMSYFKVIPEPPSRKGLHDRIGFTEKFKIWYSIAFREIEHQIGLYRTEYAAQQQAVMEVLPDE